MLLSYCEYVEAILFSMKFEWQKKVLSNQSQYLILFPEQHNLLEVNGGLVRQRGRQVLHCSVWRTICRS